jgi:hypothetical protein
MSSKQLELEITHDIDVTVILRRLVPLLPLADHRVQLANDHSHYVLKFLELVATLEDGTDEIGTQKLLVGITNQMIFNP